MSLKFGLLGLLNYGPLSGYELDKAFKASLNFFWRGQKSQIYRELTQMERAGWLSSTSVIQKAKPNKKIYALTPLGQEELLKWLANFDEAINEAFHVRSSFLTRVFFAGELPLEEARNALVAFRDQGQKALMALERIPKNVEKYSPFAPDEKKRRFWRLVADFGESFYKAEIDWANQALAKLEEDL
ncbi:MAG: PadR family transcriptional regulator [Deltaproteobacteria bacterium]|jgi:DNA-binding PadR family transcriptional regulator|nr:PadR family transcriptional regulator [Deltaproteobacteria bacterium]